MFAPRKNCFPIKRSSAAIQTTIIAERRYAAAESDSPSPVHNATYPATQTGHLGISANRALGTTQAKTPRMPRTHVGPFWPLAPSQHALTVVSPDVFCASASVVRASEAG